MLEGRYDIRQMAYNWEPNVPRVEKDSVGRAGEWTQIEQPEQYRYIAEFWCCSAGTTSARDNYLFIPALRSRYACRTLHIARTCLHSLITVTTI